MSQPGNREGGGTVHGAVVDVKNLREALTMSDRDIADMLGVGVKQVQAWESGRDQPDPTALANLRQVAKRLRSVQQKTAPKPRKPGPPSEGRGRRKP